MTPEQQFILRSRNRVNLKAFRERMTEEKRSENRRKDRERKKFLRAKKKHGKSPEWTRPRAAKGGKPNEKRKEVG